MGTKSALLRLLSFSALVGGGIILSAASTLAKPARDADQSCNASLWERVYNPARLEQVKSCITATGTVAESNADTDGDQHFLLKLDKGQKALLNKRNMKKKDGALVVEIVCANPVNVKKVRQTCVGYRNTILLPAVGSHVRVTGTYVIDSHNGWAEIHPASRVELIK
ncbi:MAG TPA: hypothetical protein VM053_08790 [Gemmatimonadaceae bacterium]|nr:hypothetical protein [Gemmatimonadaceae bacterium]